ncbi:MAG: hypothetical protein J6332_09615 [Abditibacteriota bacterium]|nr:hypothetical protein [Abditibacteriota bacterium]MBP5738462.1 hypothetical protein [Abditibacteriota bacterium]
MEIVIGVILVVLAGLAMGSSAWPLKILEAKYPEYKWEQLWFVSIFFGNLVFTWIVILIGLGIGNVGKVCSYVGWGPILMGNLFSFAWGIANVLCGLCMIRIGVCLTQALITGLGSSIAVLLPMCLKASGQFADSPGLNSPAGVVILCGVFGMICGVLFSSYAGLGRSKDLGAEEEERKGSFVGGLIMVIIAGILSAGLALCFVYSNGPIVDAVYAIKGGVGTLTKESVAAFKASPGYEAVAGQFWSPIIATYTTQGLAVIAGMLVNLVVPAYHMTKKKSWNVMFSGAPQVILSLIMGIQGSLAAFLCSFGMLKLGAIGASVGAGIQQAMQMIGGQMVGFIGGEWKGVGSLSKALMYTAVAALLIASIIMIVAKAMPYQTVAEIKAMFP